MKNHEAVVEFKSKADRLAQFLKEKGHAIPHMHLMEGLALYEGYRDWRTFRAVLAGGAGQHKAPETRQADVVDKPDLRITQDDIAKSEFFMGDKTVTLYLELSSACADSAGPDFCQVKVDQQWVESLYLVQGMSATEQGTVSSVNLAASWGPADIAFAMRDGVGQVSYDTIWFTGMNAENGLPVATEEYRITDLLSHVAKAIRDEEPDVFLLPEGPALHTLLHQLGKLRPAKVQPLATEKSVTAYFNASTQAVGLGPDFYSVQVSASWLNQLRGLQHASGQIRQTVYDATLAPVCIDNEHPWVIVEEGIAVSRGTFWFYATQKFGPRIESGRFDIEEFIKKAEAALAIVASGLEMYLLEEQHQLRRLMFQLNRKPGHPQYQGAPLTKQEQWALSSCLTYWGELSYAEVLAILDGEWEGQRDRFDAKDRFVGDDDEELAEAIRDAFDAYASLMTP